MNSPRATEWIIGLVIVLLGGPSSSGEDGQSVQGDSSLLLVMRDAQHANEGRYLWGEADVIAEIGTRGEPPLRRVEALVRWDGDRQRLTGTVSDRGKPPGESGPRTSRASFDLIYNIDKSIIYMPSQSLMTIASIPRRGYYLLTRLRPCDWWYGKVNSEGFTWAKETDGMLRRPPEFQRQIRLSQLDDDRIELLRDAGAEGRFRMVSSLGADGNITLYEVTIPQKDLEEKRIYSWTRDGRGRCYLKSCRVERHSPNKDGPTKGGLYLTYETIRFDPDKRPAPSIFDDRAIQAERGTVLDDQVVGKRRRIGDRSVEGLSASLDRLVPELKARGFAAPAREQ